MGRRLFQHLEQGIGRYRVQGLGRIDQRDAPAAAVGGRIEPGLQGADLVDADVLGRCFLRAGARGGLGPVFGGLGRLGALLGGQRVGPHAAQVRMIARGHPGAGRAGAAGPALAGRFAQQAGRGGRGEIQLADAGRAMDEPGVGKALALRQPGAGGLQVPGSEFGQAHAALRARKRCRSSCSARRTVSRGWLASMTWMRPGSAAARA
ncbi:Uncharacterised protein [Bordetella pseudohinzii]|uniref:Uncharacterized protein n=1 Tax=Bordetella pseudohinzii TaxID=1331258 RepID=A0A0M7HIG6_9BORD|nr:Uncharacterised protein [Bordetella pseudohinzii]